LMALIYIGVLRLVITPFFYGLIYFLQA